MTTSLFPRAVPRRTIHLYRGEWRDLLRGARADAGEAQATLAAFEDAAARHLGVTHAIATGSGRLGLRLLVGALDLPAGASVLMPAYTDESVPEAILRQGLQPVFVDVDRLSHLMEPAAAERALRPDTRAVLATHLFGAPADLDGFEALAQRGGLVLLEDCAHAIDAVSSGRRCGSVGRGALFSFVVTKAVNAFGGGLVSTSDAAIAQQLRDQLADLPMPNALGLARRVAVGCALAGVTSPPLFGAVAMPALRWLERAGGLGPAAIYDRLVRPGTVNAHVDTRMSGVQARVALAQLRRLDATQARRRQIAAQLVAALPRGVQAQLSRPGDRHAVYFLVVTCDAPEELKRALLRHGVDVGRHVMRNVGGADYPNAEWLVHHSVQLPVHPSLADRDVDRVVRALRAVG